MPLRVINAFIVCSVLATGHFAFASDIEMSRYVLDDEKITSPAERVIFATHLSINWDISQSSKFGAERAIRKAQADGYELNYLVPWAFEEANKPGNDAEFERLMKLYQSSRESFIEEVTPVVQKSMKSYFLPDVLPARYIGSYSGVIFDLELPNMKEAIVVGGFLNACLGFTIDSIIKAFQNSRSNSITLTLVTDGVYVQSCKSDSSAPTTLEQCRLDSPERFNEYLLNLKSSIQSSKPVIIKAITSSEL